MADHTPGPWTSTETVGHDGRVCVNGDGYVVALACPTGSSSYSPTYHQREANARLIAAAPELLDALCDLVMMIRIDDLVPASVSYMQQARAAIAKAEGR